MKVPIIWGLDIIDNSHYPTPQIQIQIEDEAGGESYVNLNTREIMALNEFLSKWLEQNATQLNKQDGKTT